MYVYVSSHTYTLLTLDIFTVNSEGVGWAVAGVITACSSIVTIMAATGLHSFSKEEIYYALLTEALYECICTWHPEFRVWSCVCAVRTT